MKKKQSRPLRLTQAEQALVIANKECDRLRHASVADGVAYAALQKKLADTECQLKWSRERADEHEQAVEQVHILLDTLTPAPPRKTIADVSIPVTLRFAAFLVRRCSSTC